MPTINGKACVANGRNLVSGSYDSSFGFNINGSNVTVQKVTMDSGEVALHVISTKSSGSGFWFDPNLPSGDYTISVDIKGTGTVSRLGWENISDASMTPTSNWQRVSRTGSLDGTRHAFVCYGIMDLYVKLLKIEKGKLATPLEPAPVDTVFSNGKQVYGRNLIIRTGEIANSMVGQNGYILGYSGSALMADKITVTPGEVLTFSRWGNNTNGIDNYFRYAFYTDADVLVVREAITDEHFATTVPTNATNLKVSYPVDPQVKLERGSVATPYSPAPEDVM